MQWHFFLVFLFEFWHGLLFVACCTYIYWILSSKLPIGFSAKLRLHAFLFSLTSLHKTSLYLLWYYRTNIVDNNHLSTVSKKKNLMPSWKEYHWKYCLFLVQLYYCKIFEEQMIKSYFESYFLSINEQWTYWPIIPSSYTHRCLS